MRAKTKSIIISGVEVEFIAREDERFIAFGSSGRIFRSRKGDLKLCSSNIMRRNLEDFNGSMLLANN